MDIELKEKESQNFYLHNLPYLPPASKFRQFKVRTWKGKWVKIKDTIHTPEELQKHLIRLAPRDVYFTTSRFLNPVQVGPKKWNHKPGYKLAYNLFLGSELYFDFDSLNFGEVLRLKKELKKEGYEDIKILRTGRGYHIWVLDFEDKHSELRGIADPRERENRYHGAKVKIVKRYKRMGFDFDAPITMDTRRIVRVPNTLHGASGQVIRFVK